MIGEKFGLWTVLSKAASRSGAAVFNCRCDCGTERPVLSDSLEKGKSRSCGCLQKTHGHASRGLGQKHHLYVTWCQMRQRCTNEKSQVFRHYGGRGIKVCDRWNDFANFIADMGERPPGTSIDRIDNDGNYEPTNCRWATAKEQIDNRRCTVWLTAFGETRTITQWSERVGLTAHCIRGRIKAGRTAEQALAQSGPSA